MWRFIELYNSKSNVNLILYFISNRPQNYIFPGFCIFVLRRFWIPRKCCPVQSRLIEHRIQPADESIDKQNATPTLI